MFKKIAMIRITTQDVVNFAVFAGVAAISAAAAIKIATMTTDKAVDAVISTVTSARKRS